jgi:hypothetical protein
VRLFIKLKVEASGFPKGVETEEQKIAYAEEYMRHYSVTIDIERTGMNPGLRFIAKLMLNSLWLVFHTKSI